MICPMIDGNEISAPRTEAEGQCKGRRHRLPLNCATMDSALFLSPLASSGTNNDINDGDLIIDYCQRILMSE